MGGNNSEAHSALVNAVLLEIGKRHPKVTAWKNHTGQAYTPGSVVDALNFVMSNFFKMSAADCFKLARSKLIPISFGVTGQADISGIIAPEGRRLEIEIKTGKGKQSEAQLRYQAMIKRSGGVYVLVRSLEDLVSIYQKELL